MYIYYKTNFLTFKYILNKSKRYYYEHAKSIARHSMSFSTSKLFEFNSNAYNICITRDAITISHSDLLTEIIKKEITDYLDIIFNHNFIKGYVNDVGKAQEWLLDVISKYNHLSTDFNSISRSMQRGYIKHFRKRVEKIMRNNGANDNEIALVTNTSIINAINRNRVPEDVAWAYLQ